MDSVSKRVVKPVWSSNKYREAITSANKWPIRPQSHPRRLYGTPKARHSHNNGLQLGPQISQITMSVEIEQYNKHKSQSSMAFCSTSKVKYMPLNRLSPDALSDFRWSAPTPSLFPVISRPASRPVILHGKRYTVMAIPNDSPRTDRSSIAKEEEKLSQKMDRVSEQRRRFNEAERNKSSTKMYKENTESSEYRIRRNYCLSGHRMLIKSSKDTVEEKLNRLQSTLNLQNIIRKHVEIVSDDRELTNGNTGDDELIPDTASRTVDRDSISPNDNHDSVISVNIIPGGNEDPISQRRNSIVNKSIQSAISDLETTDSDNESYTKAKESVIEMIDYYENETASDSIDKRTIMESWDSLQPNQLHAEVDPDLIERFESLFGTEEENKVVELSIFVNKMFDAETQKNHAEYWSKIMSDLSLHTVDGSLFVRLSMLARLFEDLSHDDDASVKMSLIKTHFWVRLLMRTLDASGRSQCDVLQYLTTLAKIIINRNALDGDTQKRVEECMTKLATTSALSLVNTSIEANDDTAALHVPMSHLIDSIPWIFKTHRDIFSRPLTIDDLATVMVTLPINNEV